MQAKARGCRAKSDTRLKWCTLIYSYCFPVAGAARTMLGTAGGSAATLGAAPCAIAWLFRGIAELKNRGNARFSVRVSAVEASGGGRQPLRDLLAAHAHARSFNERDTVANSEQSPGVYLRDDPVLGTQLQNHCELRVPSAERAAHYLDCALAARSDEEAHLLFTLHVYQYSVAGKGGVAGGRSRLHLVDLGRGAGQGGGTSSSQGLSLSSLGHVLLAIFNGQKHLPHREHRITQLLKECLSPITCHAAMLVHVAAGQQGQHQAYAETLATVQLASRIHRMRRRKIKFPSQSTACGPGHGLGHGLGLHGEQDMQQRGSDLEPSSSEQSADTVIYVGPADDATDGEHPPVYLPGLGEGDHRAAMGRALRGSSAEHHRPHGSPGPTRARTKQTNSPKSSPVRNASSAKSSPAKSAAGKTGAAGGAGGAEERWIDGPRVSKSRVVEARTLILKEGHAKRETWVDGPLQQKHAPGGNGLSILGNGNGPASGNYGFMDSHKKSMIRKWVENQTVHMKQMGVIQDVADDVGAALAAAAAAAAAESENDDDGLVDPKFMADGRHGRAVNGRCGRLSSGVRHRHDEEPTRPAEYRG
ncbi:hypothetical protein FOCC_FOCC004753 [Frankliniella occidentalis]|nr:hypothetical protein FOCC_FOCC004753 [Frankliniella occidentalis]